IGHGSETSWTGNAASDVSGFTNFPNTPILSQICCLTNKMDHTADCYCEAYINNPNGGVVALQGNTHYGLGSRSGVWDDENESRSSGLCTDFYRYQWLWGSDRHFQEAWLHSKNYVTSTYISGHTDSLSVWSRQVLNMLGDPELPLYTTAYSIERLAVSHPSEKATGTGSFTVTVTDSASGSPINSARVCLWCKYETSMWVRGWTNASGQVTLYPDPNIVDDTMWVTATKANYKPIESFAIVVDGSGVEEENDLPEVYSMTALGITTDNDFKLEYSLPEPSTIAFKVYDCTGREIKHISEEKEAGWYQMRINMSNSPAGLYFIRMNANGNQFTQKAVLIR
ncbi:T9SS type A sorting domain-containing protein, partial [candidate division WOR-3 bacterium]|nr:T9SS type A sorting domain-containing protein [candidate division WOR-3 bacterium]